MGKKWIWATILVGVSIFGLIIITGCSKPAVEKPPLPVPPPPPPSPPPPPLPTAKIYTISDFPRDPQTPGETIAAYVCSLISGDYEKTMSFISEEKLAAEGLPTREIWFSQTAQWRERLGVEVLEEKISGNRAEVKIKIYHKDGSSVHAFSRLVFERAKWKINGAE
ncbi:MAG: DUF4878 domain-containing protein [Candidatus Nealsonbacteria bacterium]|nr:DUF4878 domain-containing protein [Candidatus Nealsonbacteria bacterium]